MRNGYLLFVGACLGLTCVSSSAYLYEPMLNSYVPPTLTYGNMNYAFMFSGDKLRTAAGNASSLRQPQQSAITTLVKRGPSAYPAKLAASYPPDHRSSAEHLFQDLLEKFHQIERTFGVPENDVAGAVAGFLAGSYMAYHDIDFPDEHFKPLVGQMRRVIASNPEFARASDAEKQEMYEQMAILGMFMAATQMALKEHPNPQTAANMKRAAKDYLEQFLKTDASKVQITSTGLVIR